MRIFYCHSGSKADVPAKAAVEAELDETLSVFRGLNRRSGFLGIDLESPFCIQFIRRRDDCVEVELLDTSGPVAERCEAHVNFAENLIHAAFDGRDVFEVAHSSDYKWARLDMKL